MRKVCTVIVAVLFTTGCKSAVNQSDPEVQQNFSQLQDAQKTRDAAKRLKTLADNNADARRDLATRLPGLISNSQPQSWGNPVWLNAVRLAGDLRIAEAVPVLAKSLEYENRGGPMTVASVEDLDNDPVGKA